MKLISRARRKLREFVAGSRFEHALRSVALGRLSGRSSANFLIAPPGEGNIGDQAMVDAFVENVHGSIVIVERNPGSINVPTGHEHRVTKCTVNGLVYAASLLQHLRAVRQFGQLISPESTVSLVGADSMDGAYNAAASARRSGLAEIFALRGVDSRILGFSWNGSAVPRARDGLRRAGAAGAKLFLRDPLSMRRALEDQILGAEEATDTVFALRKIEPRFAATFLQGVDERVALVNVSGLISKKFPGQRDEYALVIERLLELNYRVVLVPHVLRSTASDLTACSELKAAFAERVMLVERQLTPAEMKGLCERASLTVTGRMHLAILSLSSGVPPITLSTQGKVEGLMEKFGYPGWCVEPLPGLAQRVIEEIELIDADPEAVRSRLLEGRYDIIEGALRNFDGLRK